MTLPDLGAHAGFILTAYAVSVLVIAALIGWVRLDHARQRALLADLEARGIGRRSADRT